MLRKNFISGILLLCVFADPLVGTFSWLYFRRIIVKKEVEKHLVAGFEEDNLVVLKFTKAESQTKLRWEHPGEFEYNRQMYDVVKKVTHGETVYYWCWWDQAETKLNRRLEELAAQTAGKDPKIGEKHRPWFSHFKSLYCSAYKHWNIPAPEPINGRVCSFSTFHASIFLQPPTPPPRFG